MIILPYPTLHVPILPYLPYLIATLCYPVLSLATLSYPTYVLYTLSYPIQHIPYITLHTCIWPTLSIYVPYPTLYLCYPILPYIPILLYPTLSYPHWIFRSFIYSVYLNLLNWCKNIIYSFIILVFVQVNWFKLHRDKTSMHMYMYVSTRELEYM